MIIYWKSDSVHRYKWWCLHIWANSVWVTPYNYWIEVCLLLVLYVYHLKKTSTGLEYTRAALSINLVKSKLIGFGHARLLLHRLHTNTLHLATWWGRVLIWVNFDPIHAGHWAKVGGGCSFEHSFTIQWYMHACLHYMYTVHFGIEHRYWNQLVSQNRKDLACKATFPQ